MIAGVLVRHARWILAVSVFGGILLPNLAAAFRPYLAPAVFMLLTIALIRADADRLTALARRPGRIGLVLLWLLAGAPLAAAAVVLPMDISPGLAAAIVMMAASAPLMSAPALSALAGLDATLAVAGTVPATLLLPLTAPYASAWLSGLPLALEPVDMLARLALLVGGSLATALVARRLLGPDGLAAHARRLDAGSVLFLCFFAVAIMDGVGGELTERTLRTLAIIAGAFAANLGLQAVGALLFGWLGRREALTIGLISGNCNMALMLAALPPDAPRDIALFFALGQFPIYLLPALTLPVYRRLLRARVAE